MPDFIMLAALIGLGYLIWDCVEVGRNDATNLVNAVFGARNRYASSSQSASTAGSASASRTRNAP